MNYLMLQSITQLISRAFMYAALLLILPSYVTLSDSIHYANIVLLMTLAGISNQFDGGYGTTLVAHVVRLGKGASIGSLLKEAVFFTALWSAFLGGILIAIWELLGSAKDFHGLSFFEMCALIMVCMLCAIANVVNRILFARDFDKFTALYLIAGPAVGLVALGFLRIYGWDSLVVISCAICLGYLIAIFAPVAKGWIDSIDCAPIASHESLRSDSNRRLIFLSQLINIVLVAKNPYLIKSLGGVDDLGSYSIYAAFNSMILAPVAAMQMPLMVRMKESIIKKDSSSVAMYFYAAGFIALSLGVIVVGVARFDFVKYIYIKNTKFGIFESIVIVVSGFFASISVVYALNLIAQQKGRLLVLSGLVVVVFDYLLIILLFPRFGSIVFLISIAVANLFSIAVVDSILRYRKRGSGFF